MSTGKSGVRPVVRPGSADEDALECARGALAVAPRRSPVLGDRYRLVSPIGQGGTSTVWRARDLVEERDVAVKLVASELRAQPEIARFSREVELVKQLDGPAFVEVLDHGVADAGPYIVMTLLEGESLHERLAARGRLRPHETVALLEGIAGGLERAHALEVVHRDLKPGNLFFERALDDPEHDETVKILDFGIAKDTWGARITQTGTTLGTAPYMSPEQLRANATVDRRSDLWSLAVVLFRCLTGTLPVVGTGVQLSLAIVEGKVAKPSSVLPGLTPRVDAFFARALALDPAARYQSATEMLEAYAEVIADLEPAAVPSQPPRAGRASVSPTAVGPAGYDVYAALASSGGRATGDGPHEHPTVVAPVGRIEEGAIEASRTSEIPTMAGRDLPSSWLRERASIHLIAESLARSRTRWRIALAVLGVWLALALVGLALVGLR